MQTKARPIARPIGPHFRPAGVDGSDLSMSPTRTISAPDLSKLPGWGQRVQGDSRHGDGEEEASDPREISSSRLTPCFYHQRFDDAVNLDRVLEQIAACDDEISHTRLMQTATSVREISKQLRRRPIKRDVKTVMIVTKARDNELVLLTKQLAEWLLKTPRYGADRGVVVYVDAKLKSSKRFDAASIQGADAAFETMLRYWTPELCINTPEIFDLVLTLGGDGTVLYTSWLFQRVVPPVLSFSLGTLGFLTNFSFDDYQNTLDHIMCGTGMRVNMRMRFACTVYRAPPKRRKKRSSASSTLDTPVSRYGGLTMTSSAVALPDALHYTVPSNVDLPSTNASMNSFNSQSSTPSTAPTHSKMTRESTFEVLNELVLDRGPSPYVSNLELYGDEHLLTIIQADGVIISTPTGSTAYSLSAGGPLTHPSIPGILLTPICPHTLSFRPMVLSDTIMLRLVVPRNSRGGAYASFDGKGRVELKPGDEVHVEVGRYPFPTVVEEGGMDGDWFNSVRRALRWNTRAAVQGASRSSQTGRVGRSHNLPTRLGNDQASLNNHIPRLSIDIPSRKVDDISAQKRTEMRNTSSAHVETPVSKLASNEFSFDSKPPDRFTKTTRVGSYIPQSSSGNLSEDIIDQSDEEDNEGYEDAEENQWDIDADPS